MEKRKSILDDVMVKNGVTQEALIKAAMNHYGIEEKAAKKIVIEVLNYREVSKEKVKTLVTLAKGTPEEVNKAVLVAKAVNSDKKKELDAKGKADAEAAAQASWDKWDDQIMKPYVEGIYAQADQLVAEAKKAEEEKAAKEAAKAKAKAEAKVEKKDKADAAPAKKEAGASEDPFAE